MRDLLQVLWNVIILWVLWPIWWPLMVVLLVATAGPIGAQDPRRPRGTIVFNAWGLALLCLGWRDVK